MAGSGPGGMKIHLAQIPEEGLHRIVQIELGVMGRLVESLGPQPERLEAELWIKNREGNVQIQGTLRTTLHPPCQRCLEPVPLVVEEALYMALAPERDYNAVPADVHLSRGDLEVSYYAGEELDLSQILEDELLLLVPELVTDEDEDGRCLICGKTLDELLPVQEEPGEDHPFGQLKRILREE